MNYNKNNRNSWECSLKSSKWVLSGLKIKLGRLQSALIWRKFKFINGIGTRRKKRKKRCTKNYIKINYINEVVLKSLYKVFKIDWGQNKYNKIYEFFDKKRNIRHHRWVSKNNYIINLIFIRNNLTLLLKIIYWIFNYIIILFD